MLATNARRINFFFYAVTDRDVKHLFAPFGKIKDILINHDAEYVSAPQLERDSYGYTLTRDF